MAKKRFSKKEFNRWLGTFHKEIANELTELNFTYGALIQAKMKERAPVDTGYLRRQIILGHPTPLSIKIKSVAEYSAAVEFGTSRTRPQPFFFNTFDEYKNEYIKECEKILSQVLK